MHEIDLTTHMDIFYHAMNYTSKGIIDASCCGGFKRRSARRQGKLLKTLPNETTIFHLNLQGAAAE